MALSISVWSDIACPWCYVGKRRLEAAIELYRAQSGANAEPIEVTWRSFELDPRTKDASDKTPYVQRLANKYGKSISQAQGMLDNMTRTGADNKIAFNFADAVAANTFNAHRLLQWALDTDHQRSTEGAQIKLKEAFVKAHLEQGVDLGKTTELLSVVDSVGLDVDRASAILASDEYASDVRADEEEAQMHGITGVPFFAIGRFGVAGAQASETLLGVILRAVDEEKLAKQERAQVDSAEGAICTPEGC
jgi:predicted DsbA family dithiol-disulfide isomerase